MNFIEFINEKKDFQNFNIQKITSQEAKDRGMFGIVYHGTTEENWENIKKNGFKIEYDTPRNSYDEKTYGNTELFPPIHHLGYGVYFTTKKAIGMAYNKGTSKNLYKFYLDIPNICEINFGVERTMMKWWNDNGFDKISNNKDILKDRMKATIKMTDVLKNKYDAVWFKGKGYSGRLLDGDQICVYDTSKIYLLDDSNVIGYNIGAKVERLEDKIGHKYSYVNGVFEPISNYIEIPKGMKGVITDKHSIGEQTKNFKNDDGLGYFYGCDYGYSVKWNKGGTEGNVREKDMKLL